MIEGVGICITRMTADQFKQGMLIFPTFTTESRQELIFTSFYSTFAVMPQPPDLMQLPPKPINPSPQPLTTSEFEQQPQFH